MGGREKTLLELDGKPLLAHVIKRLAPQVGSIAINANGDPSRFRQFGIEVAGDGDDERRGPLAGVLAGMKLAERMGKPRIVTVAGDTPFFPEDLVTLLVRASELQTAPIVLAATRNSEQRLSMHPTFGLWEAGLAGDLESALDGGTRKVLDWTDTHWTVPVEFTSEGHDPFFNINNPQDLAEAERMVKEREP